MKKNGALYILILLNLTVLLIFPADLLAQEVSQEWVLQAQNNETPLSTFGTYENQELAMEAMSDIPGPSDAPSAYLFTKAVKNRQVSGDHNVTITYWMGEEQPTDPEWSYFGAGTSEFVETEAEMVQLIKEFYEARPDRCGPVAISPKDEWVTTLAGYEGKVEHRNYNI